MAGDERLTALFPGSTCSLVEEGRALVLWEAFYRAAEDRTGSGGCCQGSWDKEGGRRGRVSWWSSAHTAVKRNEEL